MYIFNMHVQCADRFTEVLSEDLKTAELGVEHLISQVLLILFDTVLLENVSIFLYSSQSNEQTYYWLDVYAQCANISIPSLTVHLDNLELTLEEMLCCVLIELFGEVHVDMPLSGKRFFSPFIRTVHHQVTVPSSSQSALIEERIRLILRNN